MTIIRHLLLFSLIATAAHAKPHVFVSLAGTLLEAEITATAGDSITLKRVSDNQTLIVKRSTLCKQDQTFIAAWMIENPDKAVVTTATAPAAVAAATIQKYSISCQVLPSKSTRGAADGGTRTIEVSYAFNINNREVKRDIEGAKGIVLTLGKNAAQNNGDLIVLQKETFDVSIRAQSKMAYSTPPVQLTYYKGETTRYGVSSHGYVLILCDAAGNILFTESTPDGNTKFTKEILAITEVPCVIDRDFKLQPKADVPTGYITF